MTIPRHVLDELEQRYERALLSWAQVKDTCEIVGVSRADYLNFFMERQPALTWTANQ